MRWSAGAPDTPRGATLPPMLPLRDDLRTRRTPVVTYLLILANVGIFLYLISLPEAGQVRFVARYAVIPAHLVARPALDWTTLISAAFLHAGWLHLGGNMLALWIFGNNVEDRMGRARFLAFYLACGAIAGIAQVAADPTSTIPNLGASGAIAAVMAAYLRWFPGARVLVLVPIFILPWLVRLPALIVIGVWFALQLLAGSAELGQGVAGVGGVAYLAHIGGFVAGFILAPMFEGAARRSF